MDRLIGALKKQLGQAGGPKRVDLVEENVSELIGETARGTQSHVRTLQGGMSSGGSCVTSTISKSWGGSEVDIADETEKWGNVIRTLNIKAE